MRRGVYVRCLHPTKVRHDLNTTVQCYCLLWPEDLADHMLNEHGVESGPTETVEDGGREANPHTCDCGEPAVYFSNRERKCEVCRQSESNVKPDIRPGYCIKCRRIQPEDGDEICGVCRGRYSRAGAMGRPSVARRGQ